MYLSERKRERMRANGFLSCNTWVQFGVVSEHQMIVSLHNNAYLCNTAIGHSMRYNKVGTNFRSNQLLLRLNIVLRLRMMCPLDATT